MLKNNLPKYRKHKASGQAIVTLCGRDFYLGPHGSKVSQAEYDRVIGEWLANGRQLKKSTESITVVELVAAYLRWAKGYYRKNGKETDTVASISNAVKPVLELYGRHSVDEFGPLALQSCMAKMVQSDWSRSYINHCLGIIKRMFKWGSSQELIAGKIHQDLLSVSGLGRGRTEARETGPVQPVDDSTVETTIAKVSPVVADMIRLQLLTGMRPNEVCQIRPADIDTAGDVWLFKPENHKTEHHGMARLVAIGSQGQAILRPYLARDAAEYCFSPLESEQARRAKLHSERKTPLSCGNRPGTNVKRKPAREAGRCYTADSYRRAIHRGCDLAKIDRWSPNRLRHAKATKTRAQFGLEAAQVTLGHSKANVTQVYAERDMAKAIEIARQVG